MLWEVMQRVHPPLPVTLVAALTLNLCSGCATVLGTALSPLTGPADLSWIAIENGEWYLLPLTIVAGIGLGPIWGIGNGVMYDYNYRGRAYWGDDFSRVFFPFRSAALFDRGKPWQSPFSKGSDQQFSPRS